MVTKITLRGSNNVIPDKIVGSELYGDTGVGSQWVTKCSVFDLHERQKLVLGGECFDGKQLSPVRCFSLGTRLPHRSGWGDLALCSWQKCEIRGDLLAAVGLGIPKLLLLKHIC